MNMNPEPLEELLIDRELGGSSPAVDALLDAYLAEHEHARRLKDSVANTVAAARRAMAPPSEKRLPPFPAERLLRERRRQTPRTRAWAGLALAASVVLAFLAGAWFERPAAISPLAQFTARSDNAAGDAEPGFWSARRWYDRAATPPRGAAQRVEWTSPLKSPKIGGST